MASPEWETLRDLASGIKEHTLSHLADYIEQFVTQAEKNGVVVHFAADAEEHNAIVHKLMSERGMTTLVKSKSMLTDECKMREFLEPRGITVMETDLGERIQQLDHQDPSHMVVPAVHKLRADVAELFGRTIGTDPANSDIHYLAESQRMNTRPYFVRENTAGMTGCNFAVAETGTVVVCTNEGNADLSANVPPLHIASIGIEKLIPTHRRPRRVRADAVAQRARLADHAVHVALPRAASGHGDALHPRRSRPLRAPRDGRLLVLAQMHPLRRVHEYVSGVPAKRRVVVWRDVFGADRRDHQSDLRSEALQQPAVRLDDERQLHERVPGAREYPRADLQVARGDRRAP